MKEKVLQIVENALGSAEDNLYRADSQFGKMTASELLEEYGESGEQCGEIYKGYKERERELRQCVEWVNDL